MVLVRAGYGQNFEISSDYYSKFFAEVISRNPRICHEKDDGAGDKPVFALPRGGGFYSAAQTVQFACKEKTFRLLANKAYTEKMGGGELVAELKKPTPWQSIEPGSGWSVALRHACPKS